MSKWMNLSGSAACLALMTGSAAYADVNAQEVWSDWQSYMKGFGYETKATEATSGDTLNISDFEMTMQLPEGEGSIALNLGSLSLTNNGNGTVTVTLPASQPMTIHVEPRGEGPVDLTLDYTNDGTTMLVSGTPEDMTYAYTANAIGMTLKEIVVDGKEVPVNAATATITGIVGSSNMKQGNLRSMTQEMKASGLTYKIDMADPENPSQFFKLDGGMADLEFAGTGTYPMGVFDPENMARMLAAGFAFDGAFTYQNGTMAFQFTGDGENAQVNSSSESGSFNVAMSEAAIKHIIGAKGQSVNITGGDVPFPIDMKFAESLLKIITPVSKSDETRDFAIGLTLGGFETSDMIWGLIDPAGQLPRDPATVAFDLSGKGKLGFDLMDPEQSAALERGEIENPGEIESLSLNNLEVTAAGASLTGTGAFEFDFPTVMATQGMQGTDGALDLRVSGANGLMDKLVAMGLLPEDQAMGARMMMGMFAIPDGDDVLKSRIEMKPDGQVLANGQRLK